MTDLVPFEPSGVLDIPSYCDVVEAWAETCDSIPQLRDAAHELGAIEQYLARTSKEGRDRAAEAQFRLQARIGVLLGPPRPGERTDLSGATDGLSSDDRYEFRQMAAYPEVIDVVIAESTDAEPPSRRKVMERIRATRRQIEQSETPETTPTPPKPRRGPLTETADSAGVQLRKAVARMERLAEDDRYPTHRDKVAPHIRGELAYAVKVCQGLLDGLDTSPKEGQ